MKRHFLDTMKWVPAVVAIAALSLISQSTIAQSQDDRSDNNYDRQSSSRERDWQSDSPDRSRRDPRDNQNNQRSRDNRQSNTYRGSSDRNDRGGENDRPAGLGVMLEFSQGDVEVRNVAPGSPADRAGIERGDQILSVNGREIEGVQQLMRIVRTEDPGANIEFRIRRDGEERTVRAKLESLQQALESMEGDRQERGQYLEDSYRNTPPWDDNEIMRHVDAMERQVSRMQQEIEDLRAMLSDDPSQRSYSTSQRERRRDSQRRD